MKNKVLISIMLMAASQQGYCLSLKDMLKEAAKQAIEQPITSSPDGLKNQESEHQQVSEPSQRKEVVRAATWDEDYQVAVPQQQPIDSFEQELNEKGFWLDTNTGLVWSGCSVGEQWVARLKMCYEGSKRRYTWSDMILYVNNLTLYGFDDWRVPTKEEFKTIYKTKMSKVLYDYSWTSSLSTTLENGAILFDGPDVFQDDAKYHEQTAYAVRGGSSSAFEQSVELAKADLLKKQKKEQELANERRQMQDKMKLKAEQEKQAYNANAAKFQKSIKVGDYTQQGLVIEVKGALIKVQQYGKECITFSTVINPYSHSYDCLRWQKVVTGKAWMNRNELLPQ